MQVFDNSDGTNTVIGCIAWSDVHITYKGVTYNIPDGYTNAKYTWWAALSPNDFMVGNTLPTLTEDDVVVFLNKNGTHVTVPTTTVIDGSLIVEESILTNALSANCVTSEKILGGSITANEIAANEITAGHINWPTMPQIAPVRNSIMSCKKTNGVADFISITIDGSDKYVTFNGSESDPLIINFSDWFTDVGARDFVHIIKTNTSILGLEFKPNSKHYLVAYRYEDGSVVFDSTNHPPCAGDISTDFYCVETINPNMTSNTAPSGTCSASTNSSTAWKAMSEGYGYTGTTGTNPWWQYAFEAPTIIHSVYFEGEVAATYRVEASIDDVTPFVTIINDTAIPYPNFGFPETFQEFNGKNDLNGVVIDQYINIPFKRIRIIKIGTTAIGLLENVTFNRSRKIVFDVNLYRTMVKGAFSNFGVSIVASSWIPINELPLLGSTVTAMLYLGEVLTDINSQPISVISYACGGKYDSGWFDVVGSTIYSLTTNIGTNPELQNIKAIYRKNAGFASCVLTGSYFDGTNNYGIKAIGADSNNSIKFRTSIYAMQSNANYIGASDSATSQGQYRVIVDRGY